MRCINFISLSREISIGKEQGQGQRGAALDKLWNIKCLCDLGVVGNTRECRSLTTSVVVGDDVRRVVKGSGNVAGQDATIRCNGTMGATLILWVPDFTVSLSESGGLPQWDVASSAPNG